MKPLRTLSLRAETLVDQNGLMLADPTDMSVLGLNPPLPGTRLVYALQTNTQSGLTRRYLPAHPAAESAVFGMDFSAIIPLGIGIASGTLQIFTNTVPPALDTTAWTIGAVSWRDRALYATLSGGVGGTDYILRWVATDTNGNIWPRSALVLCSLTS